ncbi:tetratricopeptide repeat protein [Herbaspirillum seropedicae]|uniref:tetratricopeptide repeat protein n=1 Tax=Herbaspirillum seropedicae TaxID=964 RepID=UPI003D983199
MNSKHMVRLAAIVAAATLSYAAPAASAPRDLGAELTTANKALAAKDYSRAYALFARHAANNPLAQFSLGLFEREGWGRTSNPVAACNWFEKAAHSNIPAAQQFLGDCLAKGIGHEVDGKAAASWYRKAAASGIAYALCSAGELYIEGKTLEKDVDRGLALCLAAAQADSAPAMLRLADYYRDGKDVPQNLVAARYWYEQAAQRHQHEAQYRLGIMMSEGHGGDVDIPSALFWLEHAAMEGYRPAYLPVAILYANASPDPKTGMLSPENLAKVYMWNSAAKARTTNAVQLAEIERIEKMVLAVMPPQWQPDLDRKVAEHLAKDGDL